MSSFTITTPETSVNLRPSSVKPGETAKGTATYSVTNKTGATIRTRVRVEPGDGADQSWFTVRDGDERDIAPGATVSYSIDLAVPGGSANHSFHAVVVNLGEPDNDFEAGSAIAFDAPALEKPTGGGVKWWMIAAAVILLLVIGGGVGACLFIFHCFDSERVTVADFRGSPLEKAEEALGQQGIEVAESSLSQGAPEFDRQKFYNRIIKVQTPAPEESGGTINIDPSTTVELGWQWIPKKVTVPSLRDLKLGLAISKIEDAGLRFITAVDPVPATPPSNLHFQAVSSWHPTGQVDAGTGITLTMKWNKSNKKAQVKAWQNDYIRKKNQVTPLYKLIPGGN